MSKQPLWSPSLQQIENSNLTRFRRRVNERLGLRLQDYHQLYEWSVTAIDRFWEQIWEASEIVHSRRYDTIRVGEQMIDTAWFPGAQLNFAENLLRFRDDHPAIIHVREHFGPQRLSYRELYDQIAACAAGLRALGVKRGDRVAAFVPNVPEAVIAMLATTSIGALWSSTSPDFGFQGVLDRFGQITPKVLLCADGGYYNGKAYESLPQVEQLAAAIPSIERVVVLPIRGDMALPNDSRFVLWEKLLDHAGAPMNFEQLPFDHPVYIMYSSGTTGVPKCIVHGAGGTLLQHWKEHVLHTDVRRNDVVSYYTTCGWMMWNWLVGGLQTGATIFLYDGSPVWPDHDVLWRAIDQYGITVFGTSPKFLSLGQKHHLEPCKKCQLPTLRTILSTGAPLTAQNFAWVYDSVKPDVCLSSISGGTDIVSCFMLGNPTLPVYSEEIQCRGLGMKVEIYNERGESVVEEVGELVCTAPFPSRPVEFWNDPDRSRYRASYFENFPGVWRHGDYARLTEHGGVVVYGRSDATLKPGGVRIGTAEIYNPVEALPEVRDSLVIGQRYRGDVRIVLFVVLADGLHLDETLASKIRAAIRASATARHVPSVILQAEQIPHTLNGKKVEIAATRVIHGQSVGNRDALANPEALDHLAFLADKHLR